MAPGENEFDSPALIVVLVIMITALQWRPTKKLCIMYTDPSFYKQADGNAGPLNWEL